MNHEDFHAFSGSTVTLHMIGGQHCGFVLLRTLLKQVQIFHFN